MRKFTIVIALLFSTGAYAAESAGVTGMVITDDTVENNSFHYPKSIYTLYFPNDPAEGAKALVYVAYKKTGTHVASIELTDNNGKHLDLCTFDPATVTKLPHIQTLTCKWGGRQPDGGIDFTVYDKFDGKQEKIGGIFLSAKKPQ